ncbi:MAG: hypothetical protein LBP19_07895 [Treponema sp.]|nr:hypothetical protein [Treponema sp.]
MTLKERNVFFKIGLCMAMLAIAAVAASLAAVFRVYPLVYPILIEEAVQRPGGLLMGMLKGSVAPSAYGAFVSVLVSVAYSFVVGLCIYLSFEKTQSPEILYIAFFVMSFAFEACRVLLPFIKVNEYPAVYLFITGRIALFGRYFGVFSLLAASIYASGFNTREQKYTIIILISVSLMFALKAPLDGFSWNTALNVIQGYSALFNAVEISIAVITLTGFLISAMTRGSTAYLFISAGALLVFLGRSFLLNADIWVASILGALLLAAGTWLVCTRLHSVYLWL